MSNIIMQDVPGGGYSKVTQIDVVAVTTGISISVPATIPSNYCCFVMIDDIPEPDSELYWGLVWIGSKSTSPAEVSASNASSVLRPNGTQGTDVGWCKVESNNVELGCGPYGRCKAGSTYHVLIADMGVS